MPSAWCRGEACYGRFAVKSAWLGAALSLWGQALAAESADEILIDKSDRRLFVMHEGKAIATYRIRLGQSPVGDKMQQGDSRTPEGRYVIDRRNAGSQYHLSLGLSYPDAADRAEARAMGVLPGGDIFIHGLPNGWTGFYVLHLLFDWTDGCIAISNADIDALWTISPVGTTVLIQP